jgi:hypothetical protein
LRDQMTSTSKRKCHRKISGETFVCPDVTVHFLAHSLFTCARALVADGKDKKIDISPERSHLSQSNPFKHS